MRVFLDNELEKIKFEALFNQHDKNLQYLSYMRHLAFDDKITKISTKITTELNDDPFKKKEQFISALLAEYPTNDHFILNNILWDCQYLSLQEYTTNPYLQVLQNVEFSKNQSRLTHETIPAFRLFTSFEEYALGEKMALKLAYGFFDQDYTYPVLYLNAKKQFSLEPLEVKAMQVPLLIVKGKVLNLGLKLGYFAFMATLKEEVTEVHIVEEDLQLIALFKQYLLPLFAHPEKIHLHHAEALEFIKDIKDGDYNYIYSDLWCQAENGIETYLSLQETLCTFNLTKRFYWLENSLISQLRLLVIAVIKDAYNQNKSDYIGLKERINQSLASTTLTNSYELDTLLSIKGLRKLLLTK